MSFYWREFSVNNPEISIIVPVFKVEKYLNKCISSILSQTFKDFEWLVLDDGSTDNTGELFKKWIEEENFFNIV